MNEREAAVYQELKDKEPHIEGMAREVRKLEIQQQQAGQ